MRILLAVNSFFEDVRGGGNRVAWDAAKVLKAQGHDVALLCETIEKKPECERVGGILVLRYAVSRLNFNFLSRHQHAGCRLLRKHLSYWKPDLLWGHMPLQAVAMLKAFPGVTLSYTVHSPVGLEMLQSQTKVTANLKLKSFLISRIERQCCERASIITVLSQYTKSEIEKIHGKSIASRVQLTPGWTDVAKFHPATSRQSAKLELAWPVDRPVFFSLRRLVPRMGLDRLVAAAAIVRGRGLKFQVCIGGTGPLQGDLEKQIESLNLDCIQLLGEVPESKLSLMYSAADAFMIPTKALECFGLIAVEAMAAGTPVLSTPVGALPEIVGAIEPRWLSRDTSAEAIAELMCEFIAGKLPTHKPAELRRFVESKYAESNALEKYVRIAIGNIEVQSQNPEQTHSISR